MPFPRALLVEYGTRWLWPFAGVLILTGYFGAWVAHPVAGLVVTGLDLAEYVKFLPSIIDGGVRLWRQGFYLPLVVVSLSCSLLSYRDYYGYTFIVRLALILLGFVAALNMLPPAWTPSLLLTDEFKLQTAAIGLCTLLLVSSPVLRYFPPFAVYVSLSAIALFATWFPVTDFLSVLPDITDLYNQPVHIGWGVYLMILGTVLMIAAYLLAYRAERKTDDA